MMALSSLSIMMLLLFLLLTCTLLTLLLPVTNGAPAQVPPVRIVKSMLSGTEVQNAEVQLSMLVKAGYEIAGFVGIRSNENTDYVWTLVKKPDYSSKLPSGTDAPHSGQKPDREKLVPVIESVKEQN